MTDSNLTEALKDMAFELGADFIGIADRSSFEKSEYTGNKPQDVMKDLQSVIILGVSVPRGAFETLPKGRGEYTNTLMAATATLRIIAFQLAKRIEKEGYMATIAPSEGSEYGYWYADRETLKGDLSFKYAAYQAGIGNFGMNHLLITKDFGPKVRMTGILTDAPLDTEEKAELPLVNDACSKCLKCIDICPVDALTEEGVIHREKCAEYMFNELGGLRCGLCIKVCPLNQF
ncbi:4Fe-4S binding protein [Methanococcoides methylutens]|uniref:Iron-sulfur cluster-binding protein n=1 Tax=Methanococcoides methylutens MM1 TaxID=1434104 RepID=A0A0E3SR32_METMT|nr:4Fe-4S binding protein [Methanococcoides methylutens]AKB85266.1 Iron-sulfur cluster-binding protein [Methanococcoides methylutens MM1]